MVVSNIFNFHFGTIIQFDEHIFEMGGKKTHQLETWGHKKKDIHKNYILYTFPENFPRKSIPTKFLGHNLKTFTTFTTFTPSPSPGRPRAVRPRRWLRHQAELQQAALNLGRAFSVWNPKIRWLERRKMPPEKVIFQAPWLVTLNFRPL